MKGTQYREYLNSDEWKHLRLKKLKHSKLCWICRQQPGKINLHHVRYGNVHKSSTSDLRLVCQECHNVFHAVKNEFKEMASDYAALKQTRAIIRVLHHKSKAGQGIDKSHLHETGNIE